MVSLQELAYALALFAWIVLLVTVVTKKLYEWMRSRGLPHNVAIYYNRKVIHMGAGGLVALLTPLVFRTPALPFAFAMLLAALTYVPHGTGRLLYWFQDPENIYEVHFCITWGLSWVLSWLLLGTMLYAVVPTAFMSFGDAVTGFVRNLLFRRRTKSWVGNAAMAAVCVPVGYAYAGPWGALAGLASSVIEHFEFGPVDDNITVPLTALAVLLATRAAGLL